MKANLARFAGRAFGIKWDAGVVRVLLTIAILSAMVLSIGAGHKWN